MENLLIKQKQSCPGQKDQNPEAQFDYDFHWGGQHADTFVPKGCSAIEPISTYDLGHKAGSVRTQTLPSKRHYTPRQASGPRSRELAERQRACLARWGQSLGRLRQTA
jgi:hypothetical protein